MTSRAKPKKSPLVLVVDDDAGIRVLLMSALRAKGFRTRGAADGSKALAILKRDAGAKIALLVTDLELPGLDGLALVREIRRTRPTLKAVMISGASRPLGLETAGLSFFRKPFDLTPLIAEIRRLTS